MDFLILTTRDQPKLPLETRNTLPEKAVEVSALSESATDHQESQWHKHSGANQTSQGKESFWSLNQNDTHYHGTFNFF